MLNLGNCTHCGDFHTTTVCDAALEEARKKREAMGETTPLKTVFQAKIIKFCDQMCLVACDGRCDKAWGMNHRPKMKLGSDIDDYVYIGDDDLGTAPADPGTTEGDHAKPAGPDGGMNKWCVRECERTTMVDPGELLRLEDMNNPRPNFHSRREGEHGRVDR